MTTHMNRSPGASGTALGFLAVLVAGLVSPVNSQAQEIEEITVTARRVEEALKEVPLAITAFDSKTIEAAGIHNLGDVAALTPGLTFFNAFGENLPVPVIRGVVPQDIFGVNAAAIFVDGVYVSGREGLNFSQLDIERIEVLKGPQSAMYGRNAFSGAINYVTKAPSDVFEVRSEGEVGNQNKRRFMGEISGPILDSLTGRLSFMYDEWDGSYANSMPGGDDIGGYRYRSSQGRLSWKPLDTLTVDLGLYYSDDSIDEPATAGLPANCEDQVETTTEAQDGGPFPRLQNWCGKIPKLAYTPDALWGPAYPNMVVWPGSVTDKSMPHVPQATGEDRNLWRGNMNVNWDAGFGTFNFLTGYSDTQQSDISDFQRSSGNSVPLIYCNLESAIGVTQCGDNASWFRTPSGFIDHEYGSTVREWSQEARFTSPQEDRLRYSAGLYYYNVIQKDYPGGLIATNPLPASILELGIGPYAYPTSLAIGSYIFGQSLTDDGAIDPLVRPATQEKTESWSVFGSVDYDLTDAWQARGEIRLSQEVQKNYGYSYKRCGTDTDTFPYNDPPTAECGDDFYDLRDHVPCFQDATTGECAPGVTSGAARFETLTGRLSLKYQFESGWMAYTSVAWGEKPGGLQLIESEVVNTDGTISLEKFTNTFQPEKITAYELGIKGFTSDRRIGIDLAAFYNDWTDIVLRQLTETSPVTGLPFTSLTALNVNAGDAKVWGWEMTTDLAMTDNLTGRLTAAWTDSQLTNARQDTYSLFPTFYTNDPSCVPSAIQAIPDPTPETPTHPNDEGNEAQTAQAQTCQQESGDVSGNTQMRQPEWTASASLTYQHPLKGDWDWSARADANYLGKIFVGNDNEGWMPARTNVNLRFGVSSPRYSVSLYVRNLFENDEPIAAFRDIYWANTDDLHGTQNPTLPQEASNFDDFPPLRMSVTYPTLRTYGLIASARFGGAEE